MSTTTRTRPHGRDGSADRNLVKALSHPLRWQILNAINEGVSTPASIARRLGVRTENVSYHVRVLSDLEVIELVATTPVRGALEHHYRATRRALATDADVAEMPLELRRDAFQTVVRDTIEDLIRAGASEESYERPDVHLSRTPLLLDEQGWEQVNDVVAHALSRVLEIQAESLARMAEGEEPVRSDVVLMHFPYVPPES